MIDYSLEWRGDPRVDANDAFYLEKKNGRTALIQAYENEIEFNGRFSGKLKQGRWICNGVEYTKNKLESLFKI